jgi:hypothetical protein
MGVDSITETRPWLRALPQALSRGGSTATTPRKQILPSAVHVRPTPPAPPPSLPLARRPRPTLRALPAAQRYRIREEAGVRSLSCVEAPTVAVRVERGLCVRASDARHAAPGTIFVDGAAQGEPFADPIRGVFNLDHHEGCVRAFTLAACEQAMVLLLRGLDLRRREWTVLANDADLDAVLAIWVLLNHHRLTVPDSPARKEIMPLLRLEGVIDAHGLTMQEFCALPAELHAETRRRMERLRDHERSLRATGRWQKVDVLEYVQERLDQIDALVYPQGAFEDLFEIEELGRAALENGAVAVACKAPVGIYEVEGQLARYHGPRLGLLVLKQREGVYTLRQTDPALPASLEALYAHLNRIDPAARPEQADRRWGGSEEIGGSPRAGGTRLTTDAILAACRHVYTLRSPLRRLAQGALACAGSAAGVLLAFGAWRFAAWTDVSLAAPAFAGVLALIALCAWTLGAQGLRGLFGGRLPGGAQWLAARPFAATAALVGGAWIPAAAASTPLAERLLTALLAGVGVELLFRGFLHGRLTAADPPRTPGFGVPSAVWLSALLYAAVGQGLAAAGVLAPAPILAGASPALPASAALLFGLAAGTAREQSGSLLPPLLLHGLCAVAIAAL